SYQNLRFKSSLGSSGICSNQLSKSTVGALGCSALLASDVSLAWLLGVELICVGGSALAVCSEILLPLLGVSTSALAGLLLSLRLSDGEPDTASLSFSELEVSAGWAALLRCSISATTS